MKIYFINILAENKTYVINIFYKFLLYKNSILNYDWNVNHRYNRPTPLFIKKKNVIIRYKPWNGKINISISCKKNFKFWTPKTPDEINYNSSYPEF